MKALATIAFTAAAFIFAALAAQQPKIVLIYAHNLGFGHLGYHGNQEVKTPHHDQLAVDGALCTDLDFAAFACTVSKTMLSPMGTLRSRHRSLREARPGCHTPARCARPRGRNHVMAA